MTDSVSVEQAARLLGVSLTDTARLIVSGDLRVSAPPGVPLDAVSVRVDSARLRALLDDRAALWFSSLDRSEANRILGRKYSLRGWPPVSWSPPPVVQESYDDILNVIDNPAIIVDWLNTNGQYDSSISGMMKDLCVITKRMNRSEFDIAMAELERLDILEVVKKPTGNRGPRPKVARLRMWFYNRLNDGRPVSIAEVRARVEE